MWKRQLLSAALLVAAAGTAQATITFSFDTNGAAAGGVVSGFSLLDWAPGSALAVGGNPTGGIQTGTNVTLLYQANLGFIGNTGGTALNFTNGTNGIYLTAVAGFQEVASVSGSTVTFTGTNPAASFFKVYAVSAAGDNLAGTGFVGTSSQLILSGSLVNVLSSNFTASNLAPTTFDNHLTNDWPGVTTITGTGSTLLNWIVNYVNASYFPDLSILGSLITTTINSSLVVPFSEVDPSRLFSSNGITGANTAANIGTVNGLPGTGNGPNFEFQADANSAFDRQTIPEPGTLALLGMGLAGVAVIRRRAHNAAA